MATYVEDLIQNIYTKCDMTGLDKLNQGLRDAIWYSGELHKNIKDANRAQRQGFNFHAQAIERSQEAYKIESLRQRLEYQQANYRAKLAEQQQTWDDNRQKRQEKYNKSLQRQNKLLHFAKSIMLTWFSLGFLRNMVDTASRIQLIQQSIQGLTKSTQDWEYIQQQAFKTGTEIEVVAKGYRNFYSSAKMAGFDKSGIQGMYADTLLATRSIGASTQQTEGALLALEQMLSKGTVSMEELRRQLGNAIPGAFEIGAKAMDMTTAKFNEFVKSGKLASAVFVPKFIKALKDTYADGFKNIEQTVSVAQIRLSNSWKMLQLDIMNGETGKNFASALNTLRETLDSPEFKQFIQYLGVLFSWIVKIFNFLIKNLRLVLMLLGVRGFYGLLAKNALLFRVLNMEIGKSIRLLFLMGKHGKFAFAGMSVAAKAFMRTLFRVLLPLMAIEDFIFFLGEKFWGWNTESQLGHMIKVGESTKDAFSWDSITNWFQNSMSNAGVKDAQKILGKYLKPDDPRYVKGINAFMNKDWNTFRDIRLDAEKNPSVSLNKTEDNRVSININVNGSEQPEKVALATYNIIKDELISLGLTSDVEGTVT